MSLASSLMGIQDRVQQSAAGAGRSADAVTLVVVSKTQPVERLFEAFDLGVRDFGENTVQALVTKAQALAAVGRHARWHFIGRLQTNKINKLLPWVHLVHTVDSAPLAVALANRAPRDGLEVLVQVNIGREPQKGGADPDRVLEVAAGIAALPRLKLRGLMAIPPATAEPRPFFEALMTLSRQLSQTTRDASLVSMGMSDDFETAIQCGATHIRVGTAIFGDRPDPRERGA